MMRLLLLRVAIVSAVRVTCWCVVSPGDDIVLLGVTVIRADRVTCC